MSVSVSAVRTTIGSTELSDSDIQTKIDQARRMYEQRIGSETVDSTEKDDVVEYLACHLIKSGPEPEVTGGNDVDFNIPEEGRFWRTAVRLDPTGQLDGGDDGGSDDFTLSA